MKRALLHLVLLAAVATVATAAIDPFYRTRMDNGLRAFEQGNWELAARELRIACFGHLDEPTALAEGLIRLAIADARRGDEDAFRRSFARLTELEERFSAYSSARLRDGVRQQFEQLAAGLLSPQTLQSATAFQEIARQAEVVRLSALPPEQQRAELLSKIDAEPDRTNWLLEMVRLELAERRPQAALDWLDRLPADLAGLPPAICLRQQAAAESGVCERLDLAQPFCTDVPPPVVEFRLDCLAEADRWAEAASVLAGLDPELRSGRRITRLDRRVQKNLPADAEVVPERPLTPAAAPQPEPETETVPKPTPPASVLPPELAPLQARLAAARTNEELARLRTEAETLAERHPDGRPVLLLAAQIAYLQSDWSAAVRLYRRAGELRPDEVEPTFYLAVALYESGDRQAAAEVLRPVASRLQRSSFVESYVDRILEPGI